ncbi:MULTISPECIES: TauD/TfdA dioxygenase family protein [Thermomonospora]|uniref:Taurine dioxygenase n=1 Tax=Thermomonospora curvata (strain ATCC 19995 / DSM 43183 / JCM 3096 / KCTC 9072 / NBRC 15933 / NCIMB 10081 / Henssen B9) TaxID=471852 RepID=D1AA18_THECD|nr:MULTISPECIES: TauD/TfdA family dioxygenase [Thermomonospora]ACY96954.1 Taurine dioxygenase [Thermomonospora curvata DSM 43183]PKK15231.1 MAG: TauD/TfdA family dioxygenase [Thermomonospora sp. CIF 1]
MPKVVRIGGRIGAEIIGADLTDPDAFPTEEINRLLLEHKALIFRDAGLDEAGHRDFAARFGALTRAHPTVPSAEGLPEVLAVDADTGHRANVWHTDVTFVRTPPKISTLRAIKLPPYGGDTLIANAAAAYRDLPEPLRELADRLWAVHSNAYDYATPAKSAEYRRVFTSKVYQTAHPVVREHPETGERTLFIGGFAQRIVGLSGTESRDILRILQSYVTRPENIVRVRWNVGDLVVFDNRITQHYAPDDYDDRPRLLHRITVAGGPVTGLDGRQSYVVEGDDATDYTAPVKAA